MSTLICSYREWKWFLSYHRFPPPVDFVSILSGSSFSLTRNLFSLTAAHSRPLLFYQSVNVVHRQRIRWQHGWKVMSLRRNFLSSLDKVYRYDANEHAAINSTIDSHKSDIYTALSQLRNFSISCIESDSIFDSENDSLNSEREVCFAAVWN